MVFGKGEICMIFKSVRIYYKQKLHSSKIKKNLKIASSKTF